MFVCTRQVNSVNGVVIVYFCWYCKYIYWRRNWFMFCPNSIFLGLILVSLQNIIDVLTVNFFLRSECRSVCSRMRHKQNSTVLSLRIVSTFCDLLTFCSRGPTFETVVPLSEGRRLAPPGLFSHDCWSCVGRLKDSAIPGTDVPKVPKPESEQARGEGRDTSKRSTG